MSATTTIETTVPADETPPTTPAGGGTTGGETPAPRTFTQAELEATIAERIGRERKKYGDYDDLKKKAVEFDKVSEAQKTTEQKLAERIAELERETEQARRDADNARLDAVRSRVAARHKLPDEIAARLVGDDEAAIEADATALAKLLAPPAAPNPETGQRGGGTPAEARERTKAFVQANQRYAPL